MYYRGQTKHSLGWEGYISHDTPSGVVMATRKNSLCLRYVASNSLLYKTGTLSI